MDDLNKEIIKIIAESKKPLTKKQIEVKLNKMGWKKEDIY